MATSDRGRIAVVRGWEPDTLRPNSDVRVLDVPAVTWTSLAYSTVANAGCVVLDMFEERDEPQLIAAPGSVLAASGYPTEAQGAFRRTAEDYAAAGGTWTDEGEVVPDTGEMCLASVWGGGVGPRGREGRRARVGRRCARGGRWPPGMKACVKAASIGYGNDAALFVFGR